jgi:hypothetical protein
MQNVEGYAGSAGTEAHEWETGLIDAIIYVGLDVHKATVSVGVAESGRGGEVRQVGVFENRPEVLAKLAARLRKGGHRLSFCYEAGLCGYALHRPLTGCRHDCVVVAPSLIPMKAGDRVKTDRRDAQMLAKLHRAGELTPIWIPHAAHEAMRDLVRARATAGRIFIVRWAGAVTRPSTATADQCPGTAFTTPTRSDILTPDCRSPIADARKTRNFTPISNASKSNGAHRQRQGHRAESSWPL